MATTARRFFTEVEGVEVHWTEQGEGRPLVLLHGLRDSHRTWGRVAPALAEGHRVLTPDLPGHGLSGRPDASYALAWHAQVMAAWLDAAGLDEVDLVGHSFGGGVAQYLLLAHRERVRSLGLVAAGGLGEEVGIGLRLLSVPGVVERLGQPLMGPITRIALRGLGFFEADDVAWAGWANSMPGSARALGRTVSDVISLRGQRRGFRERAAEIADLPPTAVYWGELDPILPAAHARALEAAAPGVRVTEFAGCGHFPHRERPDEFARALKGFVDESPGLPPLRLVVVVPERVAKPSLFRRMVAAVKRLFGRGES